MSKANLLIAALKKENFRLQKQIAEKVSVPARKGVKKVSVPAIVESWLDCPPLPPQECSAWRANCGCNIRVRSIM